MLARSLSFSILLLIASYLRSQQEERIVGYPITPKNFAEVSISDDFWAPKIKVNHDVTIPIAIQKSIESGRIDNFKIAGGIMDGQFCSEYPFDDSDVFKIIEAASYSLRTFPDPRLELSIDSLIYFITIAQEQDGYLYTNRTINKNVHPWAGERRWEKVNDLSHELYNLGHLFEAATAHYITTGKRTLLDVAVRAADLVDEVFGPDKLRDYPGHQEIELGLVKLYLVTNEKRYLDLAKFFLDVRGQEGIGRPVTYNQSHFPVTEQSIAVGHAVRATYMWMAMADVAAITKNQAYIDAITRLWEDVVGTKLYIIGGIGATGNHEGFDEPYVLPNMSAYNETCAGIGNAFWNHRMFLMTGDSKYIDVMERTMYNNVLSGVSISGDRFFYPNPLSSYGQHQRSAWFGCACCPPNVARFLPNMPGLIYAQRGSDLYVNLFVSSATKFKLANEVIELSQSSDMPWHGTSKIQVNTEQPIMAQLKIRVPGWAKNQPVPSDLYKYAETYIDPIIVKLNNQQLEVKIDEKGYININRTWQKGDLLELILPMEIHKILANEKIAEDLHKVAFERGPLLYCAEWTGSVNGHVLNAIVDPAANPVLVDSEDYYGRIPVMKLPAHFTRKTLRDEIDFFEKGELTLIPYHLWNNRGPGEMEVWLATTPEVSSPLPAPTIAALSRVTASIESKSIIGVNDQQLPSGSNDRLKPYLHWWPRKGTTEWVEYIFEKPSLISQSKVYWYDDLPDGGCKIPDSYELSFFKNGEWYPIDKIEIGTVVKDDWTVSTFEPIVADGIRLTIKLNSDYATGIHEWIIE